MVEKKDEGYKIPPPIKISEDITLSEEVPSLIRRINDEATQAIFAKDRERVHPFYRKPAPVHPDHIDPWESGIPPCDTSG